MSPLPHPAILIHKLCRVCRGELMSVLPLGDLRLNAFPANRWEIDKIPQVPLNLMACTQCGLVQLDRTVPPDWMYREYWYRSGVNEMMVRELHDIVRDAMTRVDLAWGDVVVDIGANDGTLLSHYPHGITRIAWEPALNLRERLTPHAEVIIADYFPVSVDEIRKAMIITAVACAYDVEDPLAFFTAIQGLLHPQGIAIVQFQDFGQQLASTAFDNICHEHLEYYTLWSLSQIVGQVGLIVTDVTTTPINGGSLRVVLQHVDQGTVTQRVHDQLLKEHNQGLGPPLHTGGQRLAFERFRQQASTIIDQIHAVIHQLRLDSRVLDIYGASTKGNILLQVLGIDHTIARQAIDRSPEKYGLHTITGIPIVAETRARIEPADVWLSPIWQFRQSVLAREAWYLEGGGTIVFPLPQVDVVRVSWNASTEVV